MIAANYSIFGRRYGADLLMGLVAYYPFNGNANESTGLSPNGSLVGSPTFPSGKIGDCISFGNNVSANYLNIVNNTNFSFTNGTSDLPFSISLWVKIEAFSSTGNWIINKRGATSTTDEWQAIIGSTGQFNFIKLSTPSIYQGLSSPVSTFAVNQWYHVVVTDNGSETFAGMKLYVDSILISVSNVSVGTYTGMPIGSSKVSLGMASWVVDSIYKHKGMIDEVAIWKNRELNQSEVNQLYNSGSGNAYPF